MYGMKKIASSQAIAVCGRRLRGTKMSASTRIAKSTSSRAIVTIERDRSRVHAPSLACRGVSARTAQRGSLAEVHELQGDVEILALEQRHRRPAGRRGSSTARAARRPGSGS